MDKKKMVIVGVILIVAILIVLCAFLIPSKENTFEDYMSTEVDEADINYDVHYDEGVSTDYLYDTDNLMPCIRDAILNIDNEYVDDYVSITLDRSSLTGVVSDVTVLSVDYNMGEAELMLEYEDGSTETSMWLFGFSNGRLQILLKEE